MKTALDKAYEAYAARKQEERRAQMLRLRQELLASLPRPTAHSRASSTKNPAAASVPRPMTA